MSVSHAGHRKLAQLTSFGSPAVTINDSESIQDNVARITSAEHFTDTTLTTLVNYVTKTAEEEGSIEISEIRLANKQITGKGIKVLEQLLRPDILIDTIDLSHTRLGPAAVQSLAEVLTGYKQLKSLLLANVEAGDRGCMTLADMLVKPDNQLTLLDLRNNQIGSDGGRALIKALQSNRNMRRLLIGGNTIDQDIVEQINALIAESKTRKKSREDVVKSPTSLSSNMMRRPTVVENAEQFKRPDLDSINAMDRPELDPIERIGVGSVASVSAAIPRKSIMPQQLASDFSAIAQSTVTDGDTSTPKQAMNPKVDRQQRMSLVDAEITNDDDDDDDKGDTVEEVPRKRASIMDRFRRLTVTRTRKSIVVEEFSIDEAMKHCQGTEVDREQFEFLLKRVKKGSVEAMFSLGYLYDIGAGGVEPNTTEATKWYREAAANGHAIAMNNLGVLLSTGHRGKITPEYAEASHWYKQSAEKGYISGQFHLGLMYMSGSGMEKPDSKAAFYWFKQAGKQGHVLAQSNVGAMYMNGKGTEVNYKKAMKWSKKAAAHMNAVAIHNLGVMYELGYGCKPDHDKAEMMLEKARSGRVDAMIPLELSQKTIRDGGALMNL